MSEFLRSVYQRRCDEPPLFQVELLRKSVHRINGDQHAALITLLANAEKASAIARRENVNGERDALAWWARIVDHAGTLRQVRAAIATPGVDHLWQNYYFDVRDMTAGALSATQTGLRQLLLSLDPTQDEAALAQRVQTHVNSTMSLRLWITFKYRDDVQHSKRVVPCDAEEMRLNIINNVCDNPTTGMCGRDKLFSKLQATYWGIARHEVGAILRRKKAPQMTTPIPAVTTMPLRPFGLGHVQIDCTFMRNSVRLARMNSTRPTGIIVCIDRFSRFVWTHSIKGTPSGKDVAKFLNNLWLCEGAPVVLQSDRGKEFSNHEVAEACLRFLVRQTFSKSHHPQANGAVERVNQTLKRALYKIMVMYKTYKWWEFLPYVTYAYNTNIHRVTGYPPFLIQRGFMPDTTGSAIRFEDLMPRVKYATFDAVRQQESQSADDAADAQGGAVEDGAVEDGAVEDGAVGQQADASDADKLRAIRSVLGRNLMNSRQISTAVNSIRNHLSFLYHEKKGGYDSDDAEWPDSDSDGDSSQDSSQAVDVEIMREEQGWTSAARPEGSAAQLVSTPMIVTVDQARAFGDVVGIGRSLRGPVQAASLRSIRKGKATDDPQVVCDGLDRYCVCIQYQDANADPSYRWHAVTLQTGEVGMRQRNEWDDMWRKIKPVVTEKYTDAWYMNVGVREREGQLLARLAEEMDHISARRQQLGESASEDSVAAKSELDAKHEALRDEFHTQRLHVAGLKPEWTVRGIAAPGDRLVVWMSQGSSHATQMVHLSDFLDRGTRAARPSMYGVERLYEFLWLMPRFNVATLPAPVRVKESGELATESSTYQEGVRSIKGVFVPFANEDDVRSCSPMALLQWSDSMSSVSFHRLRDANGCVKAWSDFLARCRESPSLTGTTNVSATDSDRYYASCRVVGYYILEPEDNYSVRDWTDFLFAADALGPELADTMQVLPYSARYRASQTAMQLASVRIRSSAYIVMSPAMDKIHIGVDGALFASPDGAADGLEAFWSMVPGCTWRPHAPDTQIE